MGGGYDLTQSRINTGLQRYPPPYPQHTHNQHFRWIYRLNRLLSGKITCYLLSIEEKACYHPSGLISCNFLHQIEYHYIMNRPYYSLTATAPDGSSEIIFEDFDRSVVMDELSDERDSLKEQGYRNFRITSALRPEQEAYDYNDGATS